MDSAVKNPVEELWQGSLHSSKERQMRQGEIHLLVKAEWANTAVARIISHSPVYMFTVIGVFLCIYYLFFHLFI